MTISPPFSKGPCQFGELFYLDAETGRTSCQCQSTWFNHLFDGKCYEHHSVGPCPAGQYFTFDPVANKTGCTCFTAFAPDPQRGICVEKLTQDNCPVGQLVTADSVTGQLKCDCNSETMKQNYWPADGKCYQLLTQGWHTLLIYVDKLIKHESQDESLNAFFIRVEGPCETSKLFRLDDQTSLPACLPPIVSSSLRKKRNPFIGLAF